MATFKMAYELRKPETGFIFHSDLLVLFDFAKADGFRKELVAVRHRGSDLENQTACSQNLNCSHFYVTFYFRIPFLKKACAARISHIKQPYLI